ncbi:unnamed protein product [Brachionus calyciflorus]|uniref:Protein-cysteine N-palmitoyltransferase Rasp n=1 Tax=Brachionus calyciflorus TaxID=104777 RepID=A0A814NQZ2_9BILA|nr:unnamed protein product [Brachionus calyciflorus]
MFLCNSNFFSEFLDTKMQKVRPDTFNEFVVIFYFMLLRSVSFCLELIDYSNDNISHKKNDLGKKIKNVENIYNLENFLSYIYYPSFNFTSPFIPFKNFLTCMSSKTEKMSLKDVLKFILRIAFSLFLIEFFLRATSTYTTLNYTSYVSDYFSMTSYIMSMFIRGSLFASKYVVYYGIPTLINKFVGMKTTELPRCIVLIHLNSEMWRYFDTGIYEFIKNYLYIPLGGSKSNNTTKFFSLISSFVFISFWHGFGTNVSLWSLLNCSMIILETIYFSVIIKTNLTNQIAKTMSPRVKRYMICFLLVVNQIIMYLNASFFLGNLDSTLDLYKLIFLNNKNVLWHFLTVFFAMFSSTQIRLELIDLFN